MLVRPGQPKHWPILYTPLSMQKMDTTLTKTACRFKLCTLQTMSFNQNKAGSSNKRPRSSTVDGVTLLESCQCTVADTCQSCSHFTDISRSLLLKRTFMLVSVNDKSLYTSVVLITQLCMKASFTESWLLRCMLAVSIVMHQQYDLQQQKSTNG